MSKITLTDLANLQNENTAVNAINTNNAVLELALDNTVSRDGTAPNQMLANLDMNGNHITNLPTPTSNYEPLRVIDAATLGAGGSIPVSPLPVGGLTGQILEKNTNTDYDVIWADSGSLPTGGTADQILVKDTGTDFDASWQTKGLVPIGGTTGQHLIKNSNTSFDTSWAVAPTGLPAGGAKNAVLKKNTASNYDVSWSYPTENTYDPRNYGAVGDGVTDDTAAITACITAARTTEGTMVLYDGTYAHSTAINWAWEKFKVIAVTGNVKFKFTGVGVGHNFNGMTNYPASQGCAGGVFGGPNRIYLEGNASCTNLVLIDNWHFGYMHVSLKNASNALLFCQDTGIVNASSVETTFDVHITTNSWSGSFTTIPWYGIRATKLAACIFNNPIVEFVGNVPNNTPGISLIDCIGNVFYTGTVESCNAGGIAMNSGCRRNTFIGVHCEVNGTQQDWIIQGDNNTFIGCAGAGTTAGQYLDGDRNQFLNCNLQSMSVIAGATENVFDHCTFLTAFTDGGTRTSVISPDALATARDTSTSIYSNKTLDTANSNIVRLNGNTLAAAVGTATLTFPTTTDTMVGRATTDTLTNKTISGASNTITNVPIATGISGLGANVATFLATPSSANLASAVTGETGTGALVFGTSPTVTTPDIIGTATNNNAAAGSVGEYVSSVIASGSAVALTTAVPANITSISLTAGDWDVTGAVDYVVTGATNLVFALGSLSTTSATVDVTPTNVAAMGYNAAGMIPAFAPRICLPTWRVSISATTTIYLVSNQNFTASTLSGYGFIGARRVR